MAAAKPVAAVAEPQTPRTGGHQSFLVVRQFFYAKVALGICLVAMLAYALHDPMYGASGSTWLGYTLGVSSLGLMGWLAWFGVRKRQFADRAGLARDWTSAHVYLGVALLVLVTLHGGFHLGANLHALAYVLLWIVVLSGLYGVWAYRQFPQRIADNRREMVTSTMVEEIARMDETALRLSDKLDPQVHAIVTRSVASVRIGGSAWQQLSGRYAGREDQSLLELARERTARLKRASTAPAAAAGVSGDRMETVMFMADRLFDADQPAAGSGQNLLDSMAAARTQTVMFMAEQHNAGNREQRADDLKRVLDLLTQRKALVERLNRDITLRARMSVWLYLHVPATVALLAAVLAHVFVVFYFY